MARCPFCGYEGEFVLVKTWCYMWWNVYFYKCCGKFRYQVDHTDQRKSYVIGAGVEMRVRDS